MDQPSAAVRTTADYKQVLKYLDSVRRILGEDCCFLCGYEAGSLGYTLYNQLKNHHIDFVILAPATMPAARNFASYLGLMPGEDSSGPNENRLGITKAGNSHVRKLLIEAAQSYGRGLLDIKRKL